MILWGNGGSAKLGYTIPSLRCVLSELKCCRANKFSGTGGGGASCGWLGDFGDCGAFAELQHLFWSSGRKEMHGSGDDAGPSGLVAGAEAGSVITVKIFVK